MAEWYDPEYVDDGDPFRSSLQVCEHPCWNLWSGYFSLLCSTEDISEALINFINIIWLISKEIRYN